MRDVRECSEELTGEGVVAEHSGRRAGAVQGGLSEAGGAAVLGGGEALGVEVGVTLQQRRAFWVSRGQGGHTDLVVVQIGRAHV